MYRREFIRTLAASIGIATLDPEALLWVPGCKKIFIPRIVVPEVVIAEYSDFISVDMNQSEMYGVPYEYLYGKPLKLLVFDDIAR